MSETLFSPGNLATLACLLEVSAPKPGNVHRSADFEDVTFLDFVSSAVVLGQTIQSCSDKPLGETILSAVENNQLTVGTNTNLGIILLLVPLAKIAETETGELCSEKVRQFLMTITPRDSDNIFRAIGLANPGGLGKVDQMDVRDNDAGSINLLAAMQLAADRDAIARQYVNGFKDVFDAGVPLILDGRTRLSDLSQAIVFAHVELMAREPDSLIARKCGIETAKHSQFLASKAQTILRQAPRVDGDIAEDVLEDYWESVGELDFWLRSDGHRRNPGTTADLIAASLFVGIFNGQIHSPLK